MALSTSEFDYVDAIDSALTDTVWDRVRAFARRRCGELERAGLTADPDVLTMDAVTDTTLRTRVWKPENCALHVHLCGVIRSRVSHQMERGCRVRYLALGRPTDGDDFDPVEAEATATTGEDGDAHDRIAHRQHVAHVVAALFNEADLRNDNQVRALLDAYGEGVTERAEVVARLGLSMKVYRNARMRLVRMAEKLSLQLDDVVPELGRDGTDD